MRVLRNMAVIALSLFLFACGSENTVNTEPILFEIKKGDSFQTVLNNLSESNIISNPIRFKVLAKMMQKDNSIKFGVYRIEPAMSYSDLINVFSSGKTYSIKITITEGKNMFDIAEILDREGVCSKADFLAECTNPALLTQLELPAGASLEGYLFPDTYFIPLNYDAKKIVEVFLRHFNEVIDAKILDRIKELGLSLNAVLTLASIIEKESGVEFEKPVISGVFHNRLSNKMMLQADPTLIYALILEGKYDGDIRFSDFKLDSPYNTYKYGGLPPYPIANPGKSAILAALYPAETDYLYFVAKPDNSGQHVFSKTLAEHNKAVNEYRIYDRSRNPRGSK